MYDSLLIVLLIDRLLVWVIGMHLLFDKGRRQNSQQHLAEDCQILLVTLQKFASC